LLLPLPADSVATPVLTHACASWCLIRNKNWPPAAIFIFPTKAGDSPLLKMSSFTYGFGDRGIYNHS